MWLCDFQIISRWRIFCSLWLWYMKGLVILEVGQKCHFLLLHLLNCFSASNTYSFQSIFIPFQGYLSKFIWQYPFPLWEFQLTLCSSHEKVKAPLLKTSKIYPWSIFPWSSSATSHFSSYSVSVQPRYSTNTDVVAVTMMFICQVQ